MGDGATTGGPGAEETILVRISGADRPGIFAELMGVLSSTGAAIHDVEQVAVRRRLVLGVLITAPGGRDALKELLLFGWEHDVDVDFELVEPTPTERPMGAYVTVLGPTVGAEHFAALASVIAGAGGNIDRIVRLATYPVLAYELLVLGASIDDLQPGLLDVSRRLGVDVALQPEGLGRRSQRLVVMDVDSTLTMDEAIDLLAEEAGVGERVAELTRRAMGGELDFEAALRERVRLLAGLDEVAVHRARSRLRLTPGARTFVRTLKRLGFKVAIVSGGFTLFTDHLAAELGIDHAHANVLEVVDGRLTGELVGPVVDRRRKGELLAQVAAEEGIPLSQAVAVGDGANDLDMLTAAGLGVAFNAKPVVREAADTSVSVPYLDAVLFLLGVRHSEVEAADGPEAPPDGHGAGPGGPGGR